MLKLSLYSLICLCCATQDVTKQCASKPTCHECIEIAGCAWCSQEDMFDSPRCFHPNFNLPYISDVCNEEYVYFAASSVDVDDTIPNFPKQILPVKYSLNLRIGEPMYLSLKINKPDDLVELHHNASKFLKLDFKCLNDSMTPITDCEVVGGSQYIKVKIEALKCPVKQEAWNQDFIIYSTNINDFVEIAVDLLCSCPCEKKGSIGYVPNSEKCNSVGTLKCGVCECDSADMGKYCECTNNQYFGDACMPPNANSSLVCSGRGYCFCNKCHCYEKYYGNWCECNDFSCPRHNQKICSGNGKCVCGRCLCERDWLGEACECLSSVESCLNPFEMNSSICNGHGNCVCGKCQCDKQYNGQYCEKCLNCQTHCDELKYCVLCHMYKRGPYTEDDCLRKCGHQFVITNNEEENMDPGEFVCEGEENKCKYKFMYKKVDGNFQIRAFDNLQCK
ncbi:hypothetical protein RN001_012820 [Aquatica leii]|uniref:Integrin beta subunit tail domain-containing protein n=1 Tax=Aquatica leii TaxID=1421715 RepID=A0AAN7P5W1_9COLE|nr:hypothetical protein RN001_012820 [Aquatica leii]